MNPQLNYHLAREHISDLTRAAERERFARFAEHESLLSRAITRVQGGERPLAHRAPTRLTEAESAPRATDPAAAEA
jgi:hypothetical protein